MLIFKFGGNLRRYFRQITLNVDTPSQGLRLLLSQSPEFKRAFYQTRLRIRMDDDDIRNDCLEFHMNRHLKDGSTVLFAPVVEGAISAAAAAWIAVAVSVASVAYSLYMTSHIKTESAADQDQNSITNNSFTSAENRIGQGRPVPLLLGEMVIGSNVISLGIDTSNTDDWDQIIS